MLLCSQDAVDWYNAIRAAKLERKKVAFPDREEADVSHLVVKGSHIATA
jgi:hypothetical protein